jgi:hypothetical protein
LKQAFKDLGFEVGNQRKAEHLYEKYYFKRRFGPIIHYCKSARVFQDVPFSCPETYMHMDRAFPGSKFILTVRSSADEWYESLVRFHSKKFGKRGNVPDAVDLRKAEYVSKGFMFRTFTRLYGVSEESLYDRDKLISHYKRYNRNVTKYFEGRPGDLLIVNLADADAYQRFAHFLGIEAENSTFPWLNRSTEDYSSDI